MAVEGLDAQVLIEAAGFVPRAGAPERPETDSGPTLDLWATHAGGIAFAALAHPGAGAAVMSDVPIAPLTIKEMKQVAELRQFDSTDYYWDEMSTGDYEWAMTNFMHDVEAGVDRAIEDATSAQDAEQQARDYLASLGLDQVVHINTPATGPNDNIIVTGYAHHPTLLDPLVLTMADCDFGFVDWSTAYQDLDASAITVTVEDGVVLTPDQQAAVETLRQVIAHTTDLLNSLPANGIFALPDGSKISVGELRALWAKTDFSITNEVFGNGMATHPGGGAAYRNGGDPVFRVNAQDLVFLMSVPSRGGLPAA